MKKAYLIGLMTLSLVFSCTRKVNEIVPENKSGTKTDSYSTLRGGYVQINVWNGLLQFNNYQDYTSLKENLRQICENHIRIYQEAHKNLNEEEFNSKAIADNFLEEEPLVKFENNYPNYTSLRKVNSLIESNWLSQGASSNLNLLLEEHLLDEIEETLLNQFGEVKIGNTIVKYMTNGDIVNILNGDFITLVSIRNGADYNNLPNVKVVREGESVETGICPGKQTSNVKQTKAENNRRIVCNGKYRNTTTWRCVDYFNPQTGTWVTQCFLVPDGKKFKQKIKSFRLLYRIFGQPQWIRWRTNLEIKYNGNLYYPGYCSTPEFAQGTESNNRASKLVTSFNVNVPNTAIGYNEFYLYFKGGNIEHSFHL